MHILVIEDRPEDRELIVRQLQRHFTDLQLTEVSNESAFRQALEQGAFDLVLTDYALSWTDGLRVLREVKVRFPTIPVVMFTESGSEEIAVEGMHEGLNDYLLKKYPERLPVAIQSSLEQVRWQQELDHAVQELRQSRDELEARVRERTAELAAANAALRAEAQEREQLLVETRHQAAVLEAALAAMPCLVLIQDAEGRLVQMNAVAERVLGHSTKERALLAQDRALLVKLRFPGEERELRAKELPSWRARHGETVDGVLMTMQPRAAAQPIPYLVSAAPIRVPDSRTAGAVVTMQDVSPLLAMQAQMEEINSALQQRNAELQTQAQELHQRAEELRTSEQALRESEGRFREMTDHAPVLVWVSKPDGSHSFLSQPWLDFTGQPLAEGLGWGWLRAIHPGDRAAVHASFVEANAERRAFQLEYRLRRHDGVHCWVLDTGEPRVNEQGEFLGYIGSVLDITGRKQAEEALQKALAQVDQALRLSEGLNRANELIHSTLDFDQVLAHTLALAAETLGCKTAAISLRQGDEWVIRYAHGFPESVIGTRMNDREGPHTVLATGTRKPTLILDARHDERVNREHMQKWGIRSALVLPLLAQDQVIGVLVFNQHQRHVSFGDRELNFANQLASSLSLALQNARLYEQTRRSAATNATLLQEVNHRVKNNLSAIIGLIYAQLDRPEVCDQPAYQAVLGDLVRWVQGLSVVHGMLSASQWGALPLDSLVDGVVQSCLKTVLPGKVVVQVQCAPLPIPAEQAQVLALTINEVVANTAKHALGERDAGQLVVMGTQEGNEVFLTMHDDGPGYPEGVLAGTGLGVGLGLVRNLVRQNLRGWLTLRNEAGAVAEVRFPLGGAVGEKAVRGKPSSELREAQ